MLIVPIAKDVIVTKDNNKLRVVEYTNYKDGGPAVYARSANKEVILVYFFDIAEVNGTKVEYEKGSKVLRAYGKVARVQHLPQPDDKVTLMKNTISDDQDGKQRSDVSGLKLKSKALGVNKGLFVKDTEGNSFRLAQILDIDRALGGSSFDRDEFLAVYANYTGV